ncbi:hypothetical protein FRZ67_04490 [Panacibacter ginsenosidivorans]|uniref:NACHT domain-containing protein n=1 Tax=Panacibacter ginsenosidivorans TaxID=1813871 RepID=A0A5B8V5D1_9BACT|nr:hypothetical protein [Panacibacter ginsenosidivorans]QEC66590.1 hypothetical protein FRZ67_04490 [Panacibacter ginsenosidivorans]
MNIQDLKRILVSFADNASDVEITKGKLTAIIRGDIISADVLIKDGELYIKEDENELKALIWISIRIAQLEILADRIKEYIRPIGDFINPTGLLLDDIDTDPSEIEKPTSNVINCLQEKLSRKIPGTTDVIYLTSDAGEGKTTIINHLASTQANLFKKKEINWLLVPIPLGGRPFLRFDDIVIASLVNRLRFRSFYYESFIELVKLGLIVPAFDGFEEMFMENSSGEALSATGQLMSKLESNGNILIAARKAYFDYKSFSSQARLFDTIGSNSVSFSKISIDRWSKDQFIEYAFSRNVEDAETIYEIVSERLGANHPLLTRPVLVNRLLDVVPSTSELQKITSVFESSSEYFPNFVDAIITREADTKWIDTSGEPFKPLLTVEQHYDLLGIISEEMWFNSTDSLSLNIIDLLADLYSESQQFNVRTSRQVKERLRQHALLIKSDQNLNHLKFDHEEFQQFFLGIAFFNALKKDDISNFKNLMRKGLIFNPTVDTIIVRCKQQKIEIKDVVRILNIIQLNEGPTSFVKENCGNLILKILSSENSNGIILDNYSFPSNSLVGVNLDQLSFTNSYFQITAISASVIKNCIFDSCTFDGIEIDSDHVEIKNVVIKNSEIFSVQNRTTDLSFYDPLHIEKELTEIGFIFPDIEDVQEQIDQVTQESVIDDDLEIVQKILRRFIRGSHLNDNVFKIRLGNKATYFIEKLLPVLLNSGIIEEVEYIGSGQKRRFKLAMAFDKINQALKESKGGFENFVNIIKQMNS